MIVEFIGASGSGKTALARSVVRSLGEPRDAVMASDLVLRRAGLRSVRGATARNLVADLSAGVEMFGMNGKERAFLGYALRRLGRHRPRTLQTMNYLRSVVRRLGVDRIARRHGRRTLVLADEGVVLIAYLLFVYGDVEFDEEDLAEFAAMVPLPDRIVHVRAPIESLVRRTLSRPDPPRELRSRDEATVRRHLGSAAAMFDRLVAFPPLRDRVLEVENLAGEDRRRALADRIADSLRSPGRSPGASTTPRFPDTIRREV